MFILNKSSYSDENTIYYVLNHDDENHTVQLPVKVQELPSKVFYESMTEISVNGKDVKILKVMD